MGLGDLEVAKVRCGRKGGAASQPGSLHACLPAMHAGLPAMHADRHGPLALLAPPHHLAWLNTSRLLPATSLPLPAMQNVYLGLVQSVLANIGSKNTQQVWQ